MKLLNDVLPAVIMMGIIVALIVFGFSIFFYKSAKRSKFLSRYKRNGEDISKSDKVI